MKYNSLEQFLQMQIQSTQSRPGPVPSLSECRRIEKVAPHSIAARVGLARGDYLVSLNGKPAVSLPLHLYYDTSNQRKYLFYSISRKEEIDLVTHGIEPGILVQPTVESIKKHFDPQKSPPGDLMVLWEAGDWQALKELSQRVLEYHRVRDIPELLFCGASLYETGEKKKGMDMISEYLDQYSQNWTMDFTALGLYYLGRAKGEEGDSQKALKILGEAYQMAEKEPIGREYKKMAGRMPVFHKSPWLGQVFPSNYRLETLEAGKRTVGLLQTLNKMKPEQMMAVCLLGSYRGNGPYNDFMIRYYNYIRHFRDFLYGLHVITTEPQRPNDRPHYFEAEDMVRKGALPLEILFDPTGEISQKLSPPGSPHIFLLDSKQKVLFEGDLDGVEFWKVVVSRMPDAPTPPNQDKALAKLIMDLQIASFDQIRGSVEKSRLDASKSFEDILVEDGLISASQLEDLKLKLSSSAPAPITPPSQTAPLQHTVVEQGAAMEGKPKETFLADGPIAHSMVEQADTRISGSQIAVSVGASQESYGNIRPGTRLNEDLEILHLLGQGGMGAVFLAEQKSLHRKVAIKVLAPGVANAEDFRARFDREAKTAAGLSHPNIIQVYGTGQHEGQPYIVMEFVEGESLKDLIEKENPVPPKKALSIILQAARGLEAAHRNEVLHRDIKPDNIFIDKQGLVKLGDFGIAKNMNQSSLTQTGTVMGTPHYMSPEQAEGKEVDSRSDIYSLGATLYHALVGRPPFGGDSPMTVMYKQINHPVSFPREVRSSLPDLLQKTVEYMMTKDKWRRPKIMGDVVEKLEEAKQVLDGLAPVSSPSKGSPSSSAGSSPVSPGAQGVSVNSGAPGKGGDYSLSFIYSMVGGVLVVFLLILFFATSGENSSTDLTSTTPPPSDTPKKPLIPVKITPEKTVPRAPQEVYRKIDDLIAKWYFDKALALLEENKKKFPEDDFLDDKKIKVQQARANYMEEQKNIEELHQRAKVEVTLGNYSKALDFYEQVYSKRESPELKETILKITQRALHSSIAREKFEETAGNVKRLSKYGGSYPNWLDDFIKGAVEKTNREVEGFYQKLKDHLARMGVDDLEKEVESLREKYQAAGYRSSERNRLYQELNKKQKEFYKKKNKIYPTQRKYYNAFNDHINFKMKTVYNWKLSFHYKDPRRKKLDRFNDYLKQLRTKYSRLMFGQ